MFFSFFLFLSVSLFFREIYYRLIIEETRGKIT